jgi:hypothetical protein
MDSSLNPCNKHENKIPIAENTDDFKRQGIKETSFFHSFARFV